MKRNASVCAQQTWLGGLSGAVLRLLAVQVPGLSLVSGKDCAEQLLAGLTAKPNTKPRSKVAETRSATSTDQTVVQSASGLLWQSLRSPLECSSPRRKPRPQPGGSSGQLRHSTLGSLPPVGLEIALLRVRARTLSGQHSSWCYTCSSQGPTVRRQHAAGQPPQSQRHRSVEVT